MNMMRTLLADLKYIIIAMRPKQWIKNFFIFAGLFFSRNMSDLSLMLDVTIGFLLFCLAASAIYIFNDIIDIPRDKNHPKKSKRPLAAGKLSIIKAGLASLSLITVALTCSFSLDEKFALILLAYSAMNILYSIKIKQVVILDILFIAFGFILRVLAGVTLAGVYPSDWLIICSMTLALFLGFTKRRQELVFQSSDTTSRSVLSEYSVSFLDQMIAVVTACTVMSYALYTVSPETVARFHTRNLVMTVPFVLYGIFRYFYLIHKKGHGEDPTLLLLNDKPTLVNLLLWLVSVAIIIY
ncbi:decaprenyl-phosphate phosphoribosyltransferase [candidate division KSB1 bacterium]|nr:decaprenyl-phosphate phosphoribosyltransferase [candidate division KSB1 bacterium]RQW02453.1 MAG: decaprenyl-phosphate phosphoribosyltransferase [candidate division KSB1 bacterium]